MHEQANKKKKARTHKFNEVQQLPMSSGQKGREILLINQLQDTNTRDNTPLYIARESLKKRKSMDLKSDRNEVRITIGNYSDPTCCRLCGRPRSMQHCTLCDQSGGRPSSMQSQSGRSSRSTGPTFTDQPLLGGQLGGQPLPSFFSSCTLCACAVDRLSVFDCV